MKKHRPGSINASINKPSFRVKEEEQPRQSSESPTTDQELDDKEVKIVSMQL